MTTLNNQQQTLIVAVLCQKLMTAYRLLSKPEDASGNQLTLTGRNDLKRFASELCQVLLALEMPIEEIVRIAARFGIQGNL
jgi:hypothetical protein